MINKKFYLQKLKLSHLLYSVIAFGYIYNFLLMWYYSIDIPWWDEWMLLVQNWGTSIDKASFTEIITRPLWDSRILFTYMAIWISAYFDGWNSTHIEIFNYLLYGLILIFLMCFSQDLFRRTKSYISLISIFLLITPFFWETHGWHQQNHAHITTLLSFILAHILFQKNISSRAFVTAFFLIIVLVVSWGKGIVCSLVISFYHLIMKIILFKKRKIESIQLLKPLGLVVASVIASLIARGTFILDPLPKIDFLAKLSEYDKILKYFLVNCSIITGYHGSSVLGFLISLTIVFFPLGFFFYNTVVKKKNPDYFEWKILSLITAWILTLFGTALVRSYLPLRSAQCSRYAFSAMFVFPFIVAWYRYITYKSSLKIVRCIPYIILIISLFFFWKTTGFKENYSFYHDRKKEGILCIQKALYEKKTKFQCSSIAFIKDLKPAWENASKMNLTFVEKIKNTSKNNHSWLYNKINNSF
jgi:hypothetical protein